MRLAVYHHVYAVGGWADILADHLDEIRASGLAEAANVRLGVVGPREARVQVADFARGPGVTIAATAEDGWEQVTLNRLHAHAKAGEFDAVLYLHAKGVTQPCAWNTLWRRGMLRGCVTWWRACVQAIQDGADAVGCHWLTPEVWPGQVRVPFFGGNFWWATADYLARLDPPKNGNRWDAEAWIGEGNPAIVDLAPGWPGPGTVLR